MWMKVNCRCIVRSLHLNDFTEYAFKLLFYPQLTVRCGHPETLKPWIASVSTLPQNSWSQPTAANRNHSSAMSYQEAVGKQRVLYNICTDFWISLVSVQLFIYSLRPVLSTILIKFAINSIFDWHVYLRNQNSVVIVRSKAIEFEYLLRFDWIK